MVISIDQSTSATKGFLFDENGNILSSVSRAHKQYYPKPGWVEHDALEIYSNLVEIVKTLASEKGEYSLSLTNQRETVVLWDKTTGRPLSNAVVWQDTRGRKICEKLRSEGLEPLVKERTGLLLDPYFSASGASWVLDNIPGARSENTLIGTIDSFLIWKLTGGRVHATDYTNACRTLLFNINTLDWDPQMLAMFDIPRSMMPKALPCDAIFGTTTVEGFFSDPIEIAGVLGDSHAALVGQMCFSEGLAKATYGTGSSVMVNIGTTPHKAPEGLVTSIGFSALGKTSYSFEGNIHCTGATIAWLKDSLGLVSSAAEAQELACSVPDNGGVYLVPAFVGLGAPWWRQNVRGNISGLGLGSTKAHVCRAAMESIAYQVTDLALAMCEGSGVKLRELRVDGGPTSNRDLMQFQADLLGVDVVRSETSDASAYGAFIMNLFARGVLSSFEDAAALWSGDAPIKPAHDVEKYYEGWKQAVRNLITKNQ